MSNQHHLQTPRRPRSNHNHPSYRRSTITPCTRLSRMTINSQSNGSRMAAPIEYQFPTTSFNEKLLQMARDEQASTIHPNLDMYLEADKISIIDNRPSYSEDEESDEGELFSSNLCQLSPPECPVNRKSIFDDDDDDEDGDDLTCPPSAVTDTLQQCIFDNNNNNDDDDDEKEDGSIDIEYPDVYDSSLSWLSCIYQDEAVSNKNAIRIHQAGDEQGDDENRPPRHWHSRQQYEKKTRRTSPQDGENAVHERIPLREIHLDDYFSDTEDLPVNKKIVLAGRKSHKLRFMRALSPPKYISKDKGKQRMDVSFSFPSSSTSSPTSIL